MQERLRSCGVSAQGYETRRVESVSDPVASRMRMQLLRFGSVANCSAARFPSIRAHLEPSRMLSHRQECMALSIRPP